MYSVTVNNYNTFRTDTEGATKDEAIDRCSEIIGNSHGGEAYVVADDTAKRIEGEDTTEVAFTAYGIHGKPMKVNELTTEEMNNRIRRSGSNTFGG